MPLLSRSWLVYSRLCRKGMPFLDITLGYLKLRCLHILLGKRPFLRKILGSDILILGRYIPEIFNNSIFHGD